ELQPAACSLRAGTGVPGAARRAIVSMTILAACAGIRAAVLPAVRLKLPADGECPGVEVHVLPAQAKCFALPQPERESHAPPSAVPPLRGQADEPNGLVKGQRLDLALAGRWGIDKGGDVAGNITALHGDLERAGQD